MVQTFFARRAERILAHCIHWLHRLGEMLSLLITSTSNEIYIKYHIRLLYKSQHKTKKLDKEVKKWYII